MNSRLAKYLKLVGGLALLYLLSVVGLKHFNESDFAAPIQEIVREKNLNPSAFFYSDEMVVDSIEVDVTLR